MEQKKEYPSFMWEFEQRLKVAWKNRKHEIVKDSVKDGVKMGALATAIGFGTSMLMKAPFMIGTMVTQVFTGFFALALFAPTAIPAFFAFRHFKRTLYNDKMDKVIGRKIEEWRKNPDKRSIIGKYVGKAVGFALTGITVAGGIAAAAGVTVAAAAGIVAFGGPALAGTAVLAAAAQVAGFATAAIGIASPVGLMIAGLGAGVAGTGVAWKGKAVVRSWGNSLRNSLQLSEAGKQDTRGFIGNTVGRVKRFSTNFLASVFETAAERQVKKASENIQKKAKEIKNENTPAP
ncbi:MAG: hypothetical protein EA357_09620 [Micavibrio sp.]|nr:MAG: hypothetical protein EA357_09620 [Micavibrio sp.]